MDSLNHDYQADVIETFNSTDLLNIDNPYFEDMVNHIYPTELQLNKTNTTDTEVPFFRFTCFCCKCICVSSKIYDKRDGFNIVNFPFWMVTLLDVHHIVYSFLNLLGLLESAVMLRTSTRNFSSRAIINFEKYFLKFYRRHNELISKFNVVLDTSLS